MASNKLDGIHPELAAKVQRILTAMNALGFPMQVVQGVRTAPQQAALFAQGRTAPGNIVTNCDGYVKKSNHQPKGDGQGPSFGCAVDCAFVDDPKTTLNETWDDHQPWQAYGAMAEALGLVWGGRWHSVVDKPHIELSLKERG
jgi:peptidoglycan L-alanyl-D-glutamate endopeptidase CwlK